MLLSTDEDKTKANAAGALSNLVRNSNKLCEDIVDKGAMQVLNIDETMKQKISSSTTVVY